MQEIEDNLPIELRYRNPQLRAWAPIPMVNEIASVGDVAPGRPHIRSALDSLRDFAGRYQTGEISGHLTKKRAVTHIRRVRTISNVW